LSFVLIFFLIGSNTVWARVLLTAATAKQVLTKRGVGKLVRITELDGTSVTGILTALHDDDFEITPNSAQKTSTKISYAEVTEVHNDNAQKAAHSRGGQGREVAVIVIVVGAVVALVAVFATHFHPWG